MKMREAIKSAITTGSAETEKFELWTEVTSYFKKFYLVARNKRTGRIYNFSKVKDLRPLFDGTIK